MKPLSIYIHIPFCVQKCYYCDFLSAPASDKEQSDYMECLCRELEEESQCYRDYSIKTVFIGGGTPSAVDGEKIARVMSILHSRYHMESGCEISIEVNPGTVSIQKLNIYADAGINRLSIGLQSFQDEELSLLGRIHDRKAFLQTYEQADACGFTNINIDLISAIPGQTLQSYEETLKQVAGLCPQPAHISAYSLIVEEGTPFYDNCPELPDEDTERQMYKLTETFLKEHGYHRYEISNYAKAGYECSHNKVYWQRGDYAGFGIGAASMINNVRFKNTESMQEYIDYYTEITKEKDRNRLRREVLVLSLEEQMEEFMFLGLRLVCGINSARFFKQFGRTMDEVYPGIVDELCGQGLLIRQPLKDGDKQVYLTEYGQDVSNYVMGRFLLD